MKGRWGHARRPPFFPGFIFLFLLILVVSTWPGWVFPRIALIVLLFLFVMRRVGRPLGGVVAAADRVAEGDFAVRVREYGPPWLRVERTRWR